MVGGEMDGPALGGAEALVIDDSLPGLEKLVRYAKSEIVLPRLFVLKALEEILDELEVGVVIEDALPILEEMAEDGERVVRSSLAGKLGVITHAVCRPGEGEAGLSDAAYKGVRDIVFPLLETLAGDFDAEVRSAAVDAIPDLVKGLGSEGKALAVECLVPLGLGLSEDSRPESVRVDSCKVLDALAPFLPLSVLAGHILPRLSALASDPMFRIRKNVPLHMAKLCQSIALVPVFEQSSIPSFPPTIHPSSLSTEDGAGPDLDPLEDGGSSGAPSGSDGEGKRRTRRAVPWDPEWFGGEEEEDGMLFESVVQSVLNVYGTLATDSIWGVRKACAESLVSVAGVVDVETRSTLMVEHFDSFVNDVSRWVRSAAFESLGPFIATFLHAPRDAFPSKLLEFFNDMSKPSYVKSIDAEITTHCAFSFPAVILTIGKEGWPAVKTLYLTLCKDLQWKVRRTLAFSLHAVASVLGTELAEDVLVPIFDAFLGDLDEVRVGVISSVAKFLAILSPATRESYLPTLVDILDNSENWRYREHIARQLGSLVKLYPSDVVASHIVPLMGKLIRDSVAHVRRVAVTHVGPALHFMLQQLPDPTALVDKDVTAVEDLPSPLSALMASLLELGHSETYQLRVMFLHSSASIVATPGLERLFALVSDRCLALASDKVPNVRIVFCQLAERVLGRGDGEERARFGAELNRLVEDSDYGVCFKAGNVLGVE